MPNSATKRNGTVWRKGKLNQFSALPTYSFVIANHGHKGSSARWELCGWEKYFTGSLAIIRLVGSSRKACPKKKCTAVNKWSDKAETATVWGHTCDDQR